MPQHKSINDHPAVDRIYKLTDRLQDCLTDAEHVRVRFTKAREANNWPDLRGAFARLLTDNNPRGH